MKSSRYLLKKIPLVGPTAVFILHKSRKLSTLRKLCTDRRRRIQRNWRKDGKPLPPPFQHKAMVLAWYQRRFGCKVLLETGTYQGQMVEKMRKKFQKVISIELSREFFEQAAEKFKSFANISIIHGDSSKELRKIMGMINSRTLFWLDAHYSGGSTARGDTDTPIFELKTILSKGKLAHVIVIDDARPFGVNPAYPTLDELDQYVRSLDCDAEILVEDDMIRITPSPRANRFPDSRAGRNLSDRRNAPCL